MYYAFLVIAPNKICCDKCRKVKSGMFVTDGPSRLSGKANEIYCSECEPSDTLWDTTVPLSFGAASEDVLFCHACNQKISLAITYYCGVFYHPRCINHFPCDIDDGYEID